MLNCFKKTVKGDFVVIDSQFPQKEPFGFRNIEINEYFKKIDNFKSYAMYPMLPGPEAWFVHGYGLNEDDYNNNLAGYLECYPENKGRVCHLQENVNYKFKLAYSLFLAETYVLLPFFNKHKIPFVFILYPGGAFGLTNKKSDDMLRAIFSSKYFKRVITTQQITKDYLIQKEMCPVDSIDYIYGGFVQFVENQIQDKKLYLKDKQSFDVCFVAAKYSNKGVDKGYDLFIETAKEVCRQTDDVFFHVVGNFDENDIDISEIKDRITFYGFKNSDFLSGFYSKMDIFLSPNRPFKLFEGNFDGFPIGIDAGYCGSAMFVSDELDMNNEFENGKEIVIVPLDSMEISKKILYYRLHVDELYELSKNGQDKMKRLFDVNYQVTERIKVFRKLMQLKYKGVLLV